jgi:recombinational DNA repair protein RecR
MMNNDDLRAKHAEALDKIKQAEADIYFLQGYVKAIEEIINDGMSIEEFADRIGATEIEVIKNED